MTRQQIGRTRLGPGAGALGAVTGALGAVISVILAFPFLASSAAEGASATLPWPTALHDPSHTATSMTIGPTTGRIAWKRNLGGNITPGPVVGRGNVIYVASSTGVLHALDPTTGADLWTFNGGAPLAGGEDLSVSPLILPSGSILWPGSKNTLFELSSTGKALWSHTFDGAVLSPVLSGSRVYVELSTGVLWALDVDGARPKLLWSVSVGHVSFGSPVLAADGDVITTADKAIIAVADHGSTGAVGWRRALDADVEVSASVGPKGSIYVTTNSSSAYAFSDSGTLLWHKHIGQESYSSSSVSGGLLYIGDNGGALNVVHASSGDPVVVDRGRHGLWAAQAIDARGDVYFGTQGKQIEGYDAAGHRLFQLTASAPIDSYPALTGNGLFLIGDEDGTLYAIGQPMAHPSN